MQSMWKVVCWGLSSLSRHMEQSSSCSLLGHIILNSVGSGMSLPIKSHSLASNHHTRVPYPANAITMTDSHSFSIDNIKSPKKCWTWPQYISYTQVFKIVIPSLFISTKLFDADLTVTTYKVVDSGSRNNRDITTEESGQEIITCWEVTIQNAQAQNNANHTSNILITICKHL